MSGFVLGFFLLLLTRILQSPKPKPGIEDAHSQALEEDAEHNELRRWSRAKRSENAAYLKVCPHCRRTYTKWCGYCGLPEFNGANPAPPPPQEPAAKREPEPDSPTMTEYEALARFLSADERKVSGVVSAVRRLCRMTVAEKLIVALNGTREERSLLIRDPNPRVYSAVLGSPKLTDAEVESFAAMQNVSDQVLRQVSLVPEWVMRYAVMRNLVFNPRTPVDVARRFIPLLTQRDLKSLSVDRIFYEPSRRRGGGGTPLPARSSSH